MNQSIENEEDDLTTSISDAFEKAGYQRDEKGRFSDKQTEVAEEPIETTDKPIVETPASDLTLEDKPLAPTEQTNAPTSWKAELKDKWATLPPDVQAEIARREKEVHQGFTKLDEERNFGKQMRDSISPFMATIQSTGVQPHVAVSELLKTDHLLRYGTPQQKEQAFK